MAPAVAAEPPRVGIVDAVAWLVIGPGGARLARPKRRGGGAVTDLTDLTVPDVLVTGEVALDGVSAHLLTDPQLVASYLGEEMAS